MSSFTCIIMPCYNENKSVVLFLNQLKSVLENINEHFVVVVIDDYSTDDTRKLLNEYSFNLEHVKYHSLSLEYNMGHQGAIQQGLLYAETLKPNNIIVMDSDGEDDPQAIVELLKYKDYDHVPVKRLARQESFLFKCGYKAYRTLFKFIIGQEMDAGNYCMLSKRMLNNVCTGRFIHLAGFLSKQRCKRTFIEWNRKKRIGGSSKMNFSNLILHGFKSFIEFSEEFLMFFLRIFCLTSVFCVGLMANVLWKKIVTDEALPGWASQAIISLFIASLLSFCFFSIELMLLSVSTRMGRVRALSFYEVVKVE